MKLYKEIKESKKFKDTVNTCLKNMGGAYNVQVLRYALLDMQKHYNYLGVALIVKEIPEILDIVTVPDEVMSILDGLN